MDSDCVVGQVTEVQQSLMTAVTEREQWLVNTLTATRDRGAGTHMRAHDTYPLPRSLER